jgi:hypothetical protein
MATVHTTLNFNLNELAQSVTSMRPATGRVAGMSAARVPPFRGERSLLRKVARGRTPGKAGAGQSRAGPSGSEQDVIVLPPS